MKPKVDWALVCIVLCILFMGAAILFLGFEVQELKEVAR